MSTFLINASNLKNGGGLQVADSICRQLIKYKSHFFCVVLSSQLNGTLKDLEGMPNVKGIHYDMKDTWRLLLYGRNAYLDGLVEKYNVDAVLTVFGPSRWKPKVPHLCGFARAQLLKEMTHHTHHNFRELLVYKVWEWGFKRSSKVFYTENEYISEMLPGLLGKDVKVYTVTNCYNQVFDQPERWQSRVSLPCFDGTTLLTVSSTAAHKNLKIMIPVSEYLEQRYPCFHFRFVLTCRAEALNVPEHLMHHFVFVGKVNVAECPNLYEQADIMFMPTLMECSTATYPEAMRMGVPIVTTDLEFARGLCGDAACYYSALDAEAAAEAIHQVAADEAYGLRLAAFGKEQLKKFDNYEQRADKLVGILEGLTR